MEQDQIRYIGESILEKYQFAESAARSGKRLHVEFLSDLVDLTESFCVLANVSGNKELISESKSYERITGGIVTRSSCERLLEYGFFNPFDDTDDTESVQASASRQTERKDIEDDFPKITKIRVPNPETRNKVMFDRGKMIAGQYFEKGDVIERCPCQIVSSKSMYSEEIRKFAFTIDPERRIYGIPFGYGSFYRNSKQFGVEPNATYYFDQRDGMPFIVIVATNRIRKGHEIVLLSTDEDFENEIRPGQFEYPQGYEPYYAIKSVKIA